MAIEIILTFGFLMIILGSTDTRAPAGFAPIAIGLGLTLIHLISIPITNTSVNPARSTGPALIQGGIALQQLWMFSGGAADRRRPWWSGMPLAGRGGSGGQAGAVH
jgi:aquaporin Z